MRREDERLKRYMKQRKAVPERKKLKTHPICRLCTYYQPQFRYRRCLFAACPYGKGPEAVFRNKPLGRKYIVAKGGSDRV